MKETLRYVELGFASGLRTTVAPSQLSRHLAELPERGALEGTASAFLARESVRETLQIATAGEMIADKLPFVPDRTGAGPLLGRMACGAVAGGVLAELAGESPARGALLGAAGAVAGAFGGYHARRALTERLRLPDLPVALLEDVLALTLAGRAVRGE